MILYFRYGSSMAGRPKAPKNILNVPYQVVPVEQMVESIGEMNHTELVRKVNMDEDDQFPCIQWLAHIGLIASVVECPTHNEPCSLTRAKDRTDGFEWRCRVHPCSLQCSIRHGSFFRNSHLSLPILVDIIYWWSIDVPLHTMASECRLGSPNTGVDWFNFMRDVCMSFGLDQQQQIGGPDNNGNPKYVEVDESKFMHRKYHRGQWREGNWVLGGVERGTGLCFFEVF